MSPRTAKAKTAAAPGRAKAHAPGVPAHPDTIAILPARRVDEAVDQPFAAGITDQLDPDLRHRLISEAAFRRSAERGFTSDYDDEDWRDAEAEVDHVVVERPTDEK